MEHTMSWLKKLTEGLKKTSQKLTEGVKHAIQSRKLDDATLEELEDTLLMADFGVNTASQLIHALRKERFGKETTLEDIKDFLADQIEAILLPLCKPLKPSHHPHVVLMIGVNGSGKTTTAAKLAKQWQDQGKSVALVAGDTFRAAAVEQLQTWGNRLGIQVFKRETGSDSAGLAYDSYEEAKKAGIDVLIIDTAGRLHTNKGLMDELAKVRRVLQKVESTAPHDTVLILDATVGQNAYQQVKVFGESVPLTGLIITKLDGTAKGGVVVGLGQEFNLPIHALGVGEAVDDLQPFEAKDFARGLVG
jgi:fused signal recognition particle receptor